MKPLLRMPDEPNVAREINSSREIREVIGEKEIGEREGLWFQILVPSRFPLVPRVRKPLTPLVKPFGFPMEMT